MKSIEYLLLFDKNNNCRIIINENNYFKIQYLLEEIGYHCKDCKYGKNSYYIYLNRDRKILQYNSKMNYHALKNGKSFQNGDVILRKFKMGKLKL